MKFDHNSHNAFAYVLFNPSSLVGEYCLVRVVGRPCGVKCKRVSHNTFAFPSALLEAAVRADWWSMWRALNWPGLLDLLDLRGLVAHDDDDGVGDNAHNNNHQQTMKRQELRQQPIVSSARNSTNDLSNNHHSHRASAYFRAGAALLATLFLPAWRLGQLPSRAMACGGAVSLYALSG